MARALLLCAILLLLSSCALAAKLPSHTVFQSTRRLLHADHNDESANEEAAESTSYLDSLQTQGTTLTGRLDQLMNTDSATGLNEDAVNTLMQDVQGDARVAEATTAADTSLTADNIIDTYGSEDGTLNATATSTAALAILACKADSNCQLAVNSSTAVEEATDSGDNVAWLKWTGAAVLFVEALIGLCVPFFLKLHFSFMQGWFLSALNCFAGGVFLTFGFMHLLPDAVSSTPDSLSDDFPMAYFFAALGFYVLFLVQKVLSPLLGGNGHVQDASACSCTGACCAGKLPTHQVTPNPAYTDKLTQPMASDTSSISVPCTNCGCDRDPSPETAALTAAPVATGQKSYQGMTWRSWIAPVFLAAGVCVHAVLEGLALGLQRDKAGAVTVLVAMVSHKWVESVALSSITVKNGGGFKEVLCCLLPFAACFFLGTGIGVGVGRDENPWVDIVLFGLIAGAFIFVGGYELIAAEFTSSANNGRSKFRRAGLFLPVLAGFTLVALLQLVHGG